MDVREIKRTLEEAFLPDVTEINELIRKLNSRIAMLKNNQTIDKIRVFGEDKNIPKEHLSGDFSNPSSIEAYTKEMWKIAAVTILEFFLDDNRWQRIAEAVYSILTEQASVEVDSGIPVQVTCPAGTGTGQTTGPGQGRIK